MGVPAIVAASLGKGSRAVSTVPRNPYACPPYRLLKGAVSIAVSGQMNLVILYTEPGEVNWAAVKKVKDNIDRIKTTDLSTSPWVYRMDDYAVGAFLGWLVELRPGLRVKESYVGDSSHSIFEGTRPITSYEFVESVVSTDE